VLARQELSLTERIGDNPNEQTKRAQTARLACMAERRPIYSAQAAGQQIGYIEDDEAFDLFDRPCAIYDSDTGLLRDPQHNAVVGYVSLADIFVGSSKMAQELFFKTGPVPPQASLEGLEDEDSDAPVCGVEDGNVENVDAARLIAQAPPSHHTVKTDLSVASTPMQSEKANVDEHASHATDITTFASSSQQDEVVGAILPPSTSPHLGDASIEQPARPQDDSDAGKRFASGEPGSDYPSHTMGEIAPALQLDADASATMLAPSDESAFESAQPGEPSGGDGMPPAVDAFMRHLTEHIHSSNDQSATLPSSTSEAAELQRSASAEVQKDTDRVPFPSEPDPQGESSGSARHSGLVGVDPEPTEDCFSVRMESPVETAESHREGNSGAVGGLETNDASRDLFSTDKDRILLAVLRALERNSSGT
jgi:hypothetical protein